MSGRRAGCNSAGNAGNAAPPADARSRQPRSAPGGRAAPRRASIIKAPSSAPGRTSVPRGGEAAIFHVAFRGGQLRGVPFLAARRALSGRRVRRPRAMPNLSNEEIEACREAFARFDKDSSGAIDMWELRATLQCARAARRPP